MLNLDDYTSETAKPIRICAGIALLLVATVLVLMGLVGILGLLREGGWNPSRSVVAIVFSLLAVYLFGLGRRVLKGERSGNRVTVFPTWFLMVMGLPMLLGAYLVVREKWANGQLDPLLLLDMVVLPFVLLFFPLVLWIKRTKARGTLRPYVPRSEQAPERITRCNRSETGHHK